MQEWHSPSRFRAPGRRILPGGPPIPGRLQSPWPGRRSTRRWLGWACPWPSESKRIIIARGTRQWSRNPAAPRPAPPPRPCSLGQRKSRRGTPGDAVGKAMIPGVRLIRIIRADPALPFFQGRRRGARPLQEVRDPLLEVWPESHSPGFALRKTDVFQSDMT